MKNNRTSRRLYNYINTFPKVLKQPHKNEVWFALFPYETLGNMEKLRPILITKVKQDSVECRCITTNPYNAKKIKGVLAHNKHFKWLSQTSYVKDKIVEIPKYKLYGKIRNEIEMEE